LADPVGSRKWNLPVNRRLLHEFAHQLDQEDGHADGAPILTTNLLRGRAGKYHAWVRVLGSEFERLQREVSDGATTVLDAYGAKDPAEFFAVATECFFEGAPLKRFFDGNSRSQAEAD